jgi:hypothetical protein
LWICLVGTLLAPLGAHTGKGDRLLNDGQIRESKKEWDGALELYEQALREDPADALNQLRVARARFQAAQAHLAAGSKFAPPVS